MKRRYLETREKMEFIDIYFVILDKKWIYYELLKINDQKIPEMNTSEEIFKLNAQMKSKSCNLYVNGKLRNRGIQKDQNYQILICQ